MYDIYVFWLTDNEESTSGDQNYEPKENTHQNHNHGAIFLMWQGHKINVMWQTGTLGYIYNHWIHICFKVYLSIINTGVSISTS